MRYHYIGAVSVKINPKPMTQSSGTMLSIVVSSGNKSNMLLEVMSSGFHIMVMSIGFKKV